MTLISAKINKAKIRRDIAAELVREFHFSGAEYTCTAAIEKVIDASALTKAKMLLAQGINLSKSTYSFNVASNMAGMFTTDAVRIIHSEKHPQQFTKRLI